MASTLADITANQKRNLALAIAGNWQHVAANLDIGSHTIRNQVYPGASNLVCSEKLLEVLQAQQIQMNRLEKAIIDSGNRAAINPENGLGTPAMYTVDQQNILAIVAELEQQKKALEQRNQLLNFQVTQLQNQNNNLSLQVTQLQREVSKEHPNCAPGCETVDNSSVLYGPVDGQHQPIKLYGQVQVIEKIVKQVAEKGWEDVASKWGYNPSAISSNCHYGATMTQYARELVTRVVHAQRITWKQLNDALQ